MPSLYSCFGLSCFCVDPDFEFDDDDVKTKEIVNKILQLPLGDRLWPNCLGRVVRNSSPVNVEEYASRLNLEVEVEDDDDDDQSKSVPVKTIAQRTRSKAIAAAVKTSGSVQSLSSSSSDSLRIEQGLEVSSERIFAKGIRKLFSLFSFLIMSMCFSIILLILVEPYYLVVEFKPPVLKPFEGSSKELFVKRCREEKPKSFDCVRSPISFGSGSSPDHKRLKPSSVNTQSGSCVPLISDGYDPEAKPSEFAHMLDGLLLSKYVDSSSGKDSGVLVDEVAGHAYHVSLPFWHLALFFLISLLILTGRRVLVGAASLSLGTKSSQGSGV